MAILESYYYFIGIIYYMGVGENNVIVVDNEVIILVGNVFFLGRYGEGFIKKFLEEWVV